MGAQAPTALGSGRRIAIWALIVLATLLAFLSVLTVWLNRQLLDDTAWKNASTQVIQDPQVRSALSVYLVNQLYDNVDIAAELKQRLPKNVKSLAAPAAAALRGPAANAVELLLSQPRFQALWIDSSVRAHQRLVAVLENKTGYGISTGNGVVTLDAGQLVTELGTEIGLPSAVLSKVPASTGQITVMRSSQLSFVQQSVEAVRILGTWLLVLVLAMYAAAVYLARGSRRTTLRTIAWAFVLVGVLVLVVRKIAGSYVIDAIATAPYRTPAHHVWLIATSILGQTGWALILYGALGLVGVALAGPTQPARSTRRILAPLLNDHQGAAWAVLAFAYLLAVLWGGTHALRTIWGVVVLGGLLAAGFVALRRQTLAEAAADPQAFHPQWHRPDVSGWLASLRRPVARSHAGKTTSPVDELARLSELHKAGAITDEEYQRGKEIVLT